MIKTSGTLNLILWVLTDKKVRWFNFNLLQVNNSVRYLQSWDTKSICGQFRESVSE